MSLNGHDGVAVQKCTVLTLVYNHETHQVTFTVKDAPVSLLQMMVHEAQIQLDTLRRQAAQMELLKQVQDQQHTQAVLDRITGKR